jgi:hypothetical protein
MTLQIEKKTKSAECLDTLADSNQYRLCLKTRKKKCEKKNLLRQANFLKNAD